jgi:DNA-directed RNA polymerase subunit RPC12/RpoP
MSGGDKDRLGEKLHDKEQADEDRYFRERDRQLLEKMKPPQVATEEREARQATGMHCPRCGSRLEKEKLLGLGITADACPECNGLWLERAVLKQAVAHDRQTGWLARCLKRLTKG